MISFTVPEDLKEINVRNFLRRHCEVSERLLRRLKQTENGITCNGKLMKSTDILHSGDCLVLRTEEKSSDILPAELPVSIVYEDSSMILWNKPPGMPVHPVHDHQNDTLANAARLHADQMGEVYPFRAVNRLDKDTSGLVLTAKTRYAAAFLPNHVQKTYLALCEGYIGQDGTIDAPIRLKPGHTIQRETGADGIAAVTHYSVIRHYEDKYTLIRLSLETGRTHQIRVHMSSVGHPLAGDDMYGGSRERFPRQCLHCSEMSFIHPETRELCRFQADIDFFEECTTGSF